MLALPPRAKRGYAKLYQEHVLQADDLTARKYWNQLKRRLNKEGSELVTNCHRLKLPAAGCQKYQKGLEGTVQSVRR